MERFYGFDLGDAESAISILNKEDQRTPEVVSIRDTKSLVTAYAVTSDGQVLIGEEACYAAGAVKRKLRFKSHFLTDPASETDVKCFAGGMLSELYASGDLVKGSDCCFYIGCPAGWDRNAREQYRAIFERVGFPPARIVSESRAALVSACQSRHLQVGYDILSKPILVVDIGSSTTDFAYVCEGREVEMQTAGEVVLGGGIMDEILLEESVAASPNCEEIRGIFSECEPWKNYCEFAARRLKERYYSDEAYFSEHPCTETILIQYKKPVRLTLEMSKRVADLLVNRGSDRLNGGSFRSVFMKALHDVRDSISGEMPELLFLTGGVSKLPAIRKWCAEAFPEAVVITGAEPEFSVCRGLAWSGRIDAEMRDFREELEELKRSDAIEKIISGHIDELYRTAVLALVDPILENTAVPVFERWRSGEIERLSDTDEELKKDIQAYLRSEEARTLLAKPIAAWLKPIADELEEYTVPICARHNVPYTALSLSSYLSAAEIDIRIDTKNMFGVGVITLLVDSIVAILVGLLCGGSGIALLYAGPEGIIAGAFLSIVVLFLGKKKMEEAITRIKFPKLMRQMIPKNTLRSRLSSISADVKKDLYQSLESEKNEQISARLVDDVAEQIETCLTKMAEVVEIPLG